jgi:diguanylate cyclase (GGDEF)-like protein
MHFLETYLAGILYVTVPFDIVTSPGSTVLFTGKLLMLLLVYMREDAAAVRQPIYGLLIGNLLTVALVWIMRFHAVVPAAPGRLPDFGFMDEMNGLMVWGSILLFADSILLILLYEHLRGGKRLPRPVRIWVAAAAVLSFDQLGFYVALRMINDAPLSVLFDGWMVKLVTAAAYSGLIAGYLHLFERRPGRLATGRRLADVFDILTYRERYEALLARSGRDGLTGMLDRGRLETDGRVLVERCVAAGEPVSLLAIDIDHFKAVNDRFGHIAGDAVLREIAALLAASTRAADSVFRYGGEEFVVLGRGLSHAEAVAFAERLRRAVGETRFRGIPMPVTVSIGVATCPDDGTGLLQLFISADERLYEAKHGGRDRTVGDRRTAPPAPAPDPAAPPYRDPRRPPQAVSTG